MISTQVSLLKKKKVHKKPTITQFEERVHFGAFLQTFLLILVKNQHLISLTHLQ